VSSLAQRSAQAAKEIKGLISDSVEKVETGSQLVGEAGTTMNDIVQQVRHMTNLMGEITTSTAEQSTGIAQVNQAVASIDEGTQQNAALVEESAAAAESLKQQANGLMDVIRAFRTRETRMAA
jgi:methyl-accepting chemotaxis protein-1 (serine sensor receptor)